MSDDQPSFLDSALSGDTERLSAALEGGADVEACEDGRTALHHAAADGLLDVVKVLLYYKANPTKRSKMDEDNGGTALHLAAENGHTEVMEELLQAKANVEVMDTKGRHASHRAATRGQRAALELLYSHGADLDARDGGKATPLHFASYHGDLDTVRWMVDEAGVATNLKDKNGRLPKDVAKKFNNMAVQRFLKSAGNRKGGGGGGGSSGSLFGSNKARRSTRDSSRDRVAAFARDSSRDRAAAFTRDPHQHHQPPTSRHFDASPVPSSEPESLPITAHQEQDHADHDTSIRTDKHSLQPASLPAGLGREDLKRSIPSLSPPDSPPRRHGSMDRRGRESRRRTWSLGGSGRSSSKNRGLRGQVDDLMEIKTRQEEDLEFKTEELSQLKSLLSQLQQEKSQAEEQAVELRYVTETQRQQLKEATEEQQRMATVHQQEQEAARNLSARRDEEVEEVLLQARNDIGTLRERDALSQQTIESLTKKVERLSVEVKISEERLEQKEATLKEALRKVEENGAAAATVLTLREEIDHLTCMMDDTRESATIIQDQLKKKLADVREQNEKKSETIAMLSDRLREAEMNSSSTREAERQIQEMREKETESQLTIASLNAKIQQLQQNITEHDTKTLTYHKQQQAKIEELTEGNESKQVTIASLSHETEQLSARLKEQQDSIVWYQGQLQQKAREGEQKEEEHKRTIQDLREELKKLNFKLEEAHKTSLTQYERGGTVVALQKRDSAQKQTIKALENRLQHLTQKMADSEQASLSVQRQQLEKINHLQEELEEAQRKGVRQASSPPPPPLPSSSDHQAMNELREKEFQNQLVIEALNKKVEQMSEELKKNYANFFSWQTQQQEKDKEYEMREAASHQTIKELKEELDRNKSNKPYIRQAPQPWRPSGPPPPVPFNHVSPPRAEGYITAYNTEAKVGE